jgi:pyruvate,orthophosphate dikinase
VTFRQIYRISKTGSDWDGKPADQKKILGGKGAGLVDMCAMGLPVPPAFTITTEVCNAYLNGSPSFREALLDQLLDEAEQHLIWLHEQFGYTPLVSVRSGAPISMPGMMDTILNVGLTTERMTDWTQRIGQRAALDSRRRLIQMLGATAYGVDHGVFDFQLARVKKDAGVKLDTELGVDHLITVIEHYKMAFHEAKGFEFPDDVGVQLRAAIQAVFESWMNPRAIEYRKINKIDPTMGTAVTVQAMVFGNMGDSSGSGVLFTRNPSTGANEIMGEYLANAQGEDVVAGIRTPDPLHKWMIPAAGSPPSWAVDLETVCERLETHYRDMVDVEFTVQQGELFILQSRVGKRSARAAFQIAVDLNAEEVIDWEEVLTRITKEQFKVVSRPMIDPAFIAKPNAVGLPACPGVATGRAVFSAQEAINCTEPCILVTHETTPDDIAGMNKAIGILTQTGGATSHAAVVARAMDKPCVVGCTDLDIEGLKKKAQMGLVTVDGATGRVWFGIDVPVIDASNDFAVKMVLDWCMAKMKAVPQSPVDILGAHEITASTWWGDEDVMEVVLEGLEEHGSLDEVVFNVTPPHRLIPQSDMLLEGCFGNGADIINGKFWAKLHNELKVRAPKLKGMILVGVEDEVEQAIFRKHGYKVPGKEMTFEQLVSAAGFNMGNLQKAIHDPAAWNEARDLLVKAQPDNVPVPFAVPAAYAAFTVLAG